MFSVNLVIFLLLIENKLCYLNLMIQHGSLSLPDNDDWPDYRNNVNYYCCFCYKYCIWLVQSCESASEYIYIYIPILTNSLLGHVLTAASGNCSCCTTVIGIRWWNLSIANLTAVYNTAVQHNRIANYCLNGMANLLEHYRKCFTLVVNMLWRLMTTTSYYTH